MGASERDMRQGTILTFGLYNLNLKGSLGKGTKTEEKPYLFDVKPLTCFPKHHPRSRVSLLNVNST